MCTCMCMHVCIHMCMHVCVSVCVCMCVYPYVYACIYVCCICVYCYECVCAYACTYCGQPCRPTLQKSGTHMVSCGTDWSQSVHNSGLSSDCPGERDDSVKFTPLASGAVHTQWLPQVGVQRLGLFVLIQSNYKELPPPAAETPVVLYSLKPLFHMHCSSHSLIGVVLEHTPQ